MSDQASLDTYEFRVAWRMWLKYRGSTYKARGAKGQFTRLAKLGVKRAIDAIEYSMAQGYKGIYEEKRKADARQEDPNGTLALRRRMMDRIDAADQTEG